MFTAFVQVLASRSDKATFVQRNSMMGKLPKFIAHSASVGRVLSELFIPRRQTLLSSKSYTAMYTQLQVWNCRHAYGLFARWFVWLFGNLNMYRPPCRVPEIFQNGKTKRRKVILVMEVVMGDYCCVWTAASC